MDVREETIVPRPEVSLEDVKAGLERYGFSLRRETLATEDSPFDSWAYTDDQQRNVILINRDPLSGVLHLRLLSRKIDQLAGRVFVAVPCLHIDEAVRAVRETPDGIAFGEAALRAGWMRPTEDEAVRDAFIERLRQGISAVSRMEIVRALDLHVAPFGEDVLAVLLENETHPQIRDSAQRLLDLIRSKK